MPMNQDLEREIEAREKAKEEARNEVRNMSKNDKNQLDFKESNLRLIDSLTTEKEKIVRENKIVESNLLEFTENLNGKKKELKQLRTKIQDAQQRIHWLESKEDKEKNDQKTLELKLEKNLNFKLLEIKHRAVNPKMTDLVGKKQSNNGPSAALVLFFLKNPYEETIKENNNAVIPYMVILSIIKKSQVFSLTEKTKISELYYQAIEFWNLEDDNQQQEKVKNNIRRKVRFNLDDAEGVEGLLENEDEKEGNREATKEAGSRKFVLTDQRHNDLMYFKIILVFWRTKQFIALF